MSHESVMFLLCTLVVSNSLAAASEVQFNRDVRPILANKCFSCHGLDAAGREADLRLDQRPDAISDRGGYSAIVPGDDQKSRLIERVTAKDAAERMPPADSNKQLTADEVALLRTWILQGANYQRHWAFEPIVKPQPPRRPSIAVANPIDLFTAAQLQDHGWQLAPAAAPETLLRRVTLDLIGLPPTLGELESFRDSLRRPGADPTECLAHAIDRLLASNHFGEHFAVAWLDAARYADTNGYFGDKPRQMWLWRDWVVDALNSNMPFDQFTVEQIAGDMLPQPTLEQRIATGFNRNHMANNESGIVDEEFRTEYVVDRVHTTMTVWLGLTVGCAQCHDHKFDPITQREFYELFAFFNNVPETGLIRENNPPPLLEVPSADQRRQLTRLEAAVRAAAESFESVGKRLAPAVTTWEQQESSNLPVLPRQRVVWHESFPGRLAAGARSLGSTLPFERGIRGPAARFDATRHVEAWLPDFNPDEPWTIGLWLNAEGSLSCPLSLIEPIGRRRGLEVIWQKGRLVVNLVHEWGVSLIEAATAPAADRQSWHHVVVSYDGSQRASGLRVYVDGAPMPLEVSRDSLSGSLVNSEPLRIARRDSGLGFYGLLDEVRILQRELDEPSVLNWFWGERIRGVLSTAAPERSAEDSAALLDYFITHHGDAEAKAARQRVKTTIDSERRLRESIPSVLVMQEEDPPRTTHMLLRGQYDKRGEVVRPGVPLAVAPWPDGAPRDRLGLARWLVSEQNPLAARVAVNRLWQHFFGAGLVRTVDDFGSQGEPPTHPELLDWLAATFRESGWDVKGLVRQIITSRTYQQSSRFRVADSHVIDPQNRLWGRGPSGRLSAEMLRDQALAVSGLLEREMGGPSVKPYQPPGLWEAVSYDGEESYKPDSGAGLWRRSLYTYVKRQVPPPTLLTFDGPTREKCTMSRTRTNTPLQALLLLNDTTFVAAARTLAARVWQGAATEPQRLRLLWRSVLQREIQPAELAMLSGLLRRQRKRFAEDPAAAQRLLSVGSLVTERPCGPGELAAWTVVTLTMFNLDETITKR